MKKRDGVKMEKEIRLPGMKYLERVIEELEFELWKGKDDPCTSWCVTYMFNDSVESYLLLEDVTITGKYEKEKEYISLRLVEEEGRYGVVGQQEQNFFTIWFSKVTLVAALYRYADIGHFWVKGQEPLRQLVYEIEIIKDKKAYLGEWACTEKEMQLLNLLDFAPFRSYYCVPWEKGDVFDTRKNGFNAYEDILQLLGKYKLEKEKLGGCNISTKCLKKQLRLQKRLLNRLKQLPTRKREKEIFRTLKTKKGCLVYEILQQCMVEASDVYNQRSFGERADLFVDNYRKKLVEKWIKQGWVGKYPDFSRRKGFYYEQMHVEEELPFTTEQMTYQFHCMVSRCNRLKKVNLRHYFGTKDETLPLHFGFFAGCGTGKIYSYKIEMK